MVFDRKAKKIKDMRNKSEQKNSKLDINKNFGKMPEYILKYRDEKEQEAIRRMEEE